MSAAITRTDRVEGDPNEFTQGAQTSVPVKLEARPIVEDHGMTPLMRAASDGSAGTVQALLDRGADVNAKRTDGFNALALAAFFGHAQVVWLLVENGADLSATGRSETLPEMWADIRGFMVIGDTIREARDAKQVEAPNPRTTVIDEPARFPRPAETETFPAAAVAGSGVEVSVIAESLDPETPLEMIPTPVVQERHPAVIDVALETTMAIMPGPVDEESQPVIDVGPETSLAIMPEAVDEESRRPEIETACDPEATLVTPRASVNEESQSSLIDAASDPEATLVRPRALVTDGTQGSGIGPASNPEVTSAATDAPFSQESTARRVEPLADIFPPDQPENPQEAVIKPPVLKTLPEIDDPPHLLVPEFHPGSAFVARITSSRKNLVAMILAGWLVFTAVGAFLIPQILRAFGDVRTEEVTKPSLPAQSSKPIAGSEASASGSGQTAAAATTESTSPPASKKTEDATVSTTDPTINATTDTTANTKNVELTSLFDSDQVSEKSSAGKPAAKGSESAAHSKSSTSAGNSVTEALENKRTLTAATSMSRSVAPARKQRAVSRAPKFKQQTAVEEPPKPAPLSVEVNRSRSVLATPARSASEVPGSQPPPLSIISGKPKSKVIQWP